MKLDESFKLYMNLNLMHDKQDIPIYKNLKLKLRNLIAEQYYTTVNTLNKIPWILHTETNIIKCVDELIKTYILLDEIIRLTN